MRQAQVSITIGAVERDTGLSKDTLRVWERRYGFPRPQRDQHGERAYPAEQVAKLRALRRLMDLGHRPGKIVRLSLEELRYLDQDGADPAPAAGAPSAGDQDMAHWLELIKSHRLVDIRAELAQALQQMGLERFVLELAAPLTHAVGDAWAAGRFEIFEEHLYAEAMQTVLRIAIGAITPDPARPTVVLTTFPGEPHALGLLMAEAMFALEGCRCLSLGIQTPVWDIALASRAQRADIVALSFSGNAPPNMVCDGLQELRAKLPAGVQVWAGGGASVLRRKPPEGVVVLTQLADVRERVRQCAPLPKAP